MRLSLLKNFHHQTNRLPIERTAPSLDGLTDWINSTPISLDEQHGRIVLLEFWSFSCLNCLRFLPRVQAWYETYREHGLSVIGIHTPQYQFERDATRVAEMVRRYGITFAVADDDNASIWNAYGVQSWPTLFLIDEKGRIRAHHIGEGGYDAIESEMRQLLAEAGHDIKLIPPVAGNLPESELTEKTTAETYFGWDRLERLASPEPIRIGGVQEYSVPNLPAKNLFYFEGPWHIEDEHAEAAGAGCKLVMRFIGSSVFLIASGPTTATEPSASGQIRITLDGEPLHPYDNGPDTNEQSTAIIDVGRAYHLITTVNNDEHLLELEIKTPGIRLFAIYFE